MKSFCDFLVNIQRQNLFTYIFLLQEIISDVIVPYKYGLFRPYNDICIFNIIYVMRTICFHIENLSPLEIFTFIFMSSDSYEYAVTTFIMQISSLFFTAKLIR